ncbi:MAG: hypothetical protein JWL89_57 [Candidatus Saccharibacteria bacterium]|jgi:CheY-like chemotaxis protein|nr:hypothetical protein [Candidatus Saccharibacteria bacterium]
MAQILLIEPDRVLAETYYRLFVGDGHSVVVCAGAQAAIMAADQIKPDVVVMELQLIEHSGIEFLYEFRSYMDWRAVPIILQTQVQPGEFSANWELLRSELGVSQFLYKPHTTLHQLQRAVREALPQPAGLETS